jgi:hypothetical protein
MSRRTRSGASRKRKPGRFSGYRSRKYRRWREIGAGNFSVGRLIDFLTALGQDVKITVTPARKHQGQLSVVVA